MKQFILSISFVLLGLFIGFADLNAQRTNMPSSSSSSNSNETFTDSPNRKIADKLFFGGSLGANFSQNRSYIDVSPLVGYRVTDRFWPGIGMIFQRYTDRNVVPKYSTNVTGARLFARYYLWKQLFAQTEYEKTRYKDSLGAKATASRFPIGGGISQRVGNNLFINAILMYDLLWDQNATPYDSPLVFRVGVNAGLGRGGNLGNLRF